MPSFAYRAPGRQPGLRSSPLPKAAARLGGPGGVTCVPSQVGGTEHLGPSLGWGVLNTWVPPVGGCTRWGIPNRCVPPWGAADLGGSWSLPSGGRRQGEVPAHLCPFPRWGGVPGSPTPVSPPMVGGCLQTSAPHTFVPSQARGCLQPPTPVSLPWEPPHTWLPSQVGPAPRPWAGL